MQELHKNSFSSSLFDDMPEIEYRHLHCTCGYNRKFYYDDDIRGYDLQIRHARQEHVLKHPKCPRELQPYSSYLANAEMPHEEAYARRNEMVRYVYANVYDTSGMKTADLDYQIYQNHLRQCPTCRQAYNQIRQRYMYSECSEEETVASDELEDEQYDQDRLPYRVAKVNRRFSLRNHRPHEFRYA